MEHLKKQLSQVNSVIESLTVALQLCGNSSLMLEGVVTTTLDRATVLRGMMLDSLGGSKVPPLGPETDVDNEDDDFSWMDDMEATGIAPV